jgi:acylphosphatase
MIKSFAIRVSGKVQGVFYRASTSDKAISLGLYGFVRNEPDGSVYVEAEGDEQKLNQLIAWCKQGPPRAVVSAVEANEQPLKHYNRFEIMR